MTRSWYLKFIEGYAYLLLLVFPSVFLLVKGGMNGTMIFMLFCVLIVRLIPPVDLNCSNWQQDWWWYVFAMFGMTVAIFVSQLVNDDLLARPYDAASRYWLGLPIFWFLIRVNSRVFESLQYAFPIASILCFLFAADDANGYGSGFSLPSLNKILFGDYLLLLGTLSLFSINWFGQDPPLLRLLKWAGFISGLVATFQSGTRGALLALPIFFALYLYFFCKMRLSMRSAAGLLVGVALIGVGYVGSQTVRDRLHELANDVTTYEAGNRDTSTGIRWQLNIAAIRIFFDHPVAGVGPEVVGGKLDGFAREIKKMAEAGELSPGAAEVGICCQVHNEILAKMAALGILGLIAMLALYLVPLWFFWRAVQKDIRKVRYAGMLGIIFVSGHAIFGLTVGLLGLTMTAAFYSFGVAVFMAASNNTNELP